MARDDVDICKACDDLKYNAPHFTANGLTDKECESLRNNTGLDPKAQHDDCEDLNNMNDCLIAGIQEDIEAYDDCDWKLWANDMMTNLFNMIKAIVCVICGLWEEFARVWDKFAQICQALETLLRLIRGERPKAHLGYWLSSFKAKIHLSTTSGDVIPLDVNKFVPNFMADVLEGATCDSNKKIGRYYGGWAYDQDISPYLVTIQITEPVPNGTVIGVVPMNAVVGQGDMTEANWKNMLRSGKIWEWGAINNDSLLRVTTRGYVVYQGVEFNTDLKQYGENNLVYIMGPNVGGSYSGWISGDITPNVRTYNP